MSALVIQILTYLVPLVLGYLLRHWGVSVPGLPTPVAPSSNHVSLLQQVLDVGKPEAEKLLKEAVKSLLQQGLTDAQKIAPKT